MSTKTSRANDLRAACRSVCAALVPAAVGLVACACGGATRLVVPAALQADSDRWEIESLNATAPSRTIGSYQVTFFQSPDRGREVLSNGATIARWAVGVTGPDGQVALDCEAKYGSLGKGPDGGPATTSMRCSGRGTPMTLELGGKGHREGEGKLVLRGSEYVVSAVYDVDGGKAPTTPAGYTIRRSFDVEAAAESIAPEDPGAVWLGRKVEQTRRTALMAAATALVELGVLAPRPTGTARVD